MQSDATDTTQLSRLLGNVYDAVLDPSFWPIALEQACEFVGGAAANIFWQDAVDPSAAVLHAWGTRPEYDTSYFETYIKLNPMSPALTFVEPGIVVAGGDLVPHEEFRETRFFKEWVQPQGFVDVVGANLQRYETSSAAFAIRRGERHGIVDDACRHRMQLIVPHVQRAVLIGREIDRSKAVSTSLAAVLNGVSAGVFLVDGDARLGFANEPGRALLDRGDIVSKRDGALSGAAPRADRALRDAIAAANLADVRSIGRPGVSIPLTQGRQPRWLASVLPLSSGARQKASLGYQASVAVFVRKAEIPVSSGIETIARIYRLTASEIRVLQAAVSEAAVGDIAEALGLSIGTVKTHLASLFAKTGTTRRAELVREVAAHGNPLA